MKVEEFFELLLTELDSNENIRPYYKFLDNKSSFHFRKQYFIQRLQYIVDAVPSDRSVRIWDLGCGYATTALFLCLNGYKVTGSTLEFYYEEIERRKQYWSQYGDLSGLDIHYDNVFDQQPAGEWDIIIAQDTLHHLEPIGQALSIIEAKLSARGKLVAIEENGKNVIQRMKLYKQRGNKRIITIYDQKLGKEILLGNENIRSVAKWEKLFSDAGLQLLKEEVEYIRLYPPFVFSDDNFKAKIDRERSLWRKNSLLKNYFYFGTNFTAQKA